MSDFPTRDYMAMLTSRHQAAQLGLSSMEPWPADKAARLMAIVQVYGNNEGFALSPKFQCDRRYIQALYGIGGGEVPDLDFAAALKLWVERYEVIKSERSMDFQQACQWIEQMYNFKIYV